MGRTETACPTKGRTSQRDVAISKTLLRQTRRHRIVWDDNFQSFRTGTIGGADLRRRWCGTVAYDHSHMRILAESFSDL
jgi:hypothetical protein